MLLRLFVIWDQTLLCQERQFRSVVPPFDTMGVYRLLVAALVGYQAAHVALDGQFSPALQGLARLAVDVVPMACSHLVSSVYSVYYMDYASCVYSASVGQRCVYRAMEAPSAIKPWNSPVWFGLDTSISRLWETPVQRNARIMRRCSAELACYDGRYNGCDGVARSRRPAAHFFYRRVGFSGETLEWLASEATYSGFCRLLHRNGLPLPPLKVMPGIEEVVSTPAGQLASFGLSVLAFVLFVRTCCFVATLLRREHQPVRTIRRYPRYDMCPTVSCPPITKDMTLAQSLRDPSQGWTRWTHAERPWVEKVLVPFELQLTAEDWDFLHTSSYFIVMPSEVQYHAHATVAAGLEGPRLPARIVWRGCSFQRVTFKDHTQEIVRYESAPLAMVPPAPVRKFVCGGRNFAEDDAVVTMLDVGTTHESVPHYVINTIAARLATDTSGPTVLYDRVGSFFRSSCKSKNLKLSDHAAWILLVLDRMNRASSVASGNVYDNVPFDASWITRATWRLLRHFRSVNPIDMTPSPTNWSFEDSFVPAYEVHAKQDRAVLNEPLRPEMTMPFPNVRPTPDAPPCGGDQCSASPDGRECPEFNGTQSAGTPADAEPVADRIDAVQPQGGDVLPHATAPDDVPEPASVCPEPVGLGCDADRRGADYWGIDLAGPLDPTRNPISCFMGDIALYLVPIAARVGAEATVQRWDLIASGGGLPGCEGSDRTIRLSCCYDCARGGLELYKRLSSDPTKGTALGILEKRFASQNPKSSCFICVEGLPPQRSCAPLRREVLEAAIEAREQSERSNALRTMGAPVSRKAAKRARQRKAKSDRKRRAREDGRSSEVLSQE